MKEENAHSPKKNVLGSLLKTAGMIYGFYQLLNLSIFKGKDFKKPGLTEEQIRVMDDHNANHRQLDLLRFLGSGLSVGLSIIDAKSPREIEAAEKARSEGANKDLDLDVAELPEGLKHKHAE